MSHNFRKPNNQQIADTAGYWLPLMVLSLCFSAVPAAGQTTIRGVIYISPSGELEGDLVMRAAQEEVILLRGEKGFEAEFEVLSQNYTSRLNSQRLAVSQAQRNFQGATLGSRPDQEAKREILMAEKAKLTDLTETHRRKISELIAKHTFGKTVTDLHGMFIFAEVPDGRYFVHAHFKIVGMGADYYWLVAVEVRGREEIEISLTKLNALTSF